MALVRSFAGADNDADFAGFTCWDGDPENFFAEEAQNFIRGAMLWQFDSFNLAFRENGDLVAVSSFYRRTWPIPPPGPERPAWHLDVAAVSVERQRSGLSREVFTETFAVMREIDPERILVSAFVHRENLAAYGACAAVGITLWTPRDEDYVILIGEVPPQ
jgi:hypothetical protein